MKSIILLLCVITLVAAGCSSAGSSSATPTQKSEFTEEVDGAIQRFKVADPSSSKFFDTAYGWAVFPGVGKGGLIVGAAHGNGHVFEKGARVGRSEMFQGSLGLQAGGQEYVEIIFFKDKTALDDFKSGHFEMSANASAVAVRAGASTTTDYHNGVAVFTMTKGGLMAEASIGGQSFKYYAL